MKTVAIILCRLNSLRLPAKALLDLGGKPIIDRVIEQTMKAHLVDDICVATTYEEEDETLCEYLKEKYGHYHYLFSSKPLLSFFQAPNPDDVLTRFYECATHTKADIVVRVNGDSPFTEPAYIDGAIVMLKQNPELEYVTFYPIPFGMQSWVFTYAALKKLNLHALHGSLREHVTGLLDIRQLFNRACIVLKPHQYESIAVDDLASYVQACQIFRKRKKS